MTIQLYQFGDSPCCMKVRMVLAHKNISWEERFIESWKFDHFQPDYLALNPFGIVPTLIHGEHVLIQSNVIAEYLDDAYPDPPLKPSDPYITAQMREWMAAEQDHLFGLIVTMSFNTMMKLRVQGFGLEQLQAWSKRHPDQQKAQDYLTRVCAPVDVPADEAAQQKFRWHMERLQHQLQRSGGPWICGEHFTLADICVAPIMDRIAYLDREHLWDGLEAVTDWFAAVKQRECYNKGEHAFERRMWGPLKPVADYPDSY